MFMYYIIYHRLKKNICVYNNILSFYKYYGSYPSISENLTIVFVFSEPDPRGCVLIHVQHLVSTTQCTFSL